MKLEIVPFGKYKGQPVEALAQDSKYCEWLLAQDWFRSRYPPIYTVVVNQYEPAETPEHNALQALFLDEQWVKAFAIAALGGPSVIQRQFENQIKKRVDKMRENIERLQKDDSFLHDFQSAYSQLQLSEEQRKAAVKVETDRVASRIESVLRLRWQLKVRIFELEFEAGGSDVRLLVNNLASHDEDASREWRVECKPSMGDDYPAILRQMKRQSSNALLLGDGGYLGAGATFDQAEKIFSKSGIVIVRKSAVNIKDLDLPGEAPV